MKTNNTQKYLLTGTSAAALAAVSAVALPSQAFADWGTVTAATTTAQVAGNNAEALVISGAGDVATTTANAVENTDKTGTTITVNVDDAAKGISAAGEFSAVSITSTGELDSLSNTKGTITGAGTATGTATVVLDGGDNTTTVSNAADGTISNTGNGGIALYVGNVGVNQVSVNNAGSIVSSGGANSDAIVVADKTGATFTLTNTGTITGTRNAINAAAGGNTVVTINQNSGTITGGIVLGDAATSKINATGGTIAGNITLNNATQELNLSGGQVNGTVDGDGLVKVTTDYTTNGHIGSGTAVTKVIVTDAKTLDLATNNNTVKTTGGLVVGTGATGATLTVGAGGITGTIDAGQDGTSTINFTKNVATGGNIGDTAGFATINIADGTTLDATGNHAIKATNIYLGTTTGSTLTLGTGLIKGAIDAKTAGTGTINFNGDQTNAATIGGTTGIAAINIADGADVVMDANATATTVTVGGGTDGTLTLNAGKTITGAVNISDGAILTQKTTGVITGPVNGVAANKGTYHITTAGAFATNNDIGATTGLAAVKFGDGVNATIGHNIKATNVTIGDGASGTATQTAGLITGNLSLDAGSTFVIAGGSGVTGTIDGQGAGEGTLEVNSAFTSASKVGDANGLAAININNGGTFNLGGDVKATTTKVASGGTLNLGTTARTVDGALTGTGTGTINASTKNHTVNGNLTTAATNTLGFTINSGTPNDSGRITVGGGGTVAIASGTTVAIDTSGATGFIADNTKYLLVAGTDADNNGVTISGNTNFLTFTADTATNDELGVTANRTATYQSVVTNDNAKAIGTALTNLGANADVQISALQARLDTTTTSAQANAVLAEVTPQLQATSVMSSNAVQKALDVVSSRGADLRAGIDKSYRGMAAGNGVADKGVWVQAFGTAAEQDLRQGVQGYDADTYGVAIGADTMVSANTRVGVSASYGNTEVDSNGSAIQNTDIDTYQANLYAFHDMGPWFMDGLLGFAWQDYDSARFITAPASTASAEYDGQTYTARANVGYRFNASHGVELIPNGGLTYINNQIDGYTETGAGGLNLTVADYDSQALFGRVGLDVAKNYTSGSLTVRPVVRAAYLYDFIGDQASTNALFTGGGGTFRVQDADPAQHSFNVGASLNVVTTKAVTLSADYDYLVKEDYDSHSGMLRARFGF